MDDESPFREKYWPKLPRNEDPGEDWATIHDFMDKKFFNIVEVELKHGRDPEGEAMEIIAWCTEQFGPRAVTIADNNPRWTRGVWHSILNYRNSEVETFTGRFLVPAHAMAFKMRWHR